MASVLVGWIAGLAVACANTPAMLDTDWQHEAQVNHALVGKIWRASDGRFLSPDELVADLESQRVILLGEKHDNVDQHRLQAWLLARLAEHRRPAVVFEMLTPEQARALAEAEPAVDDADRFAETVAWSESGWPGFFAYRPVFEVVFAADLELVAAGLSPRELSGLRTGSLETLDPRFVKRFGLDEPLPEAARARFIEEIRESHCGHAPDAAIPGMIAIQRTRDARMAERLLAASGDAVLIAGSGHAHGGAAPAAIRKLDPTLRLAALSFTEVLPDETSATAYFDPDAAFDYLWFTPRVDLLDPCEKFREQLERMRHP